MTRIRDRFRRLSRLLLRTALSVTKGKKEAHELEFWRARFDAELTLSNSHYEHFYTSHFGLTGEFYNDKSILDIGCGPRGSLSWATQAAERIGLDTLANEYIAMGADPGGMTLVDGQAEKIPFPSLHFDVVCSFNSLDHVDDLSASLNEIHRVLKDDGTFLLIVEINHPATPTEPVEILDPEATFSSLFQINVPRKYEIGDDHDIYGQLRADAIFDERNDIDRPAIFTGILTKRIL